MILRWISQLILWLWGWKIKGGIPSNLHKLILVVAPHTSWKDFPLGLLTRSAAKIKVNYIGKSSLFQGPFGWFFRWTGGYPVERTGHAHQVEEIIQLFKTHAHFILAIAPEGTRKKVDHLRSGFCFIAKGADVPVVRVAFNGAKKEVTFSEPIYMQDDCAVEVQRLWDYYRQVPGIIPERGIS